MKKLVTIILFTFCSYPFSLFSQTSFIDSLSSVVQSLPHDTTKLNPLYALSRQLVISGEYEKAFKKIDEIKSLILEISIQKNQQIKAVKEKLKYETARMQNLTGVIYNRKADFKEALKYYLEALKTREEMGDRQSIAMTCNNISGLYSNLSDDENELKYMKLAIENFESVNDKKGMSQALYNQSLFHYRHSDYEKAIEVNLKAQKLAEEIGDKISITYCLIHTGTVYRVLGNMDKSTDCFQQALNLSNATGDKVGRGYAISNLGINYKNKGEYEKALDYHNKYLQMEMELDDKKNIANALENLGFLFNDFRKEKLNRKDTAAAEVLLDSAIAYSLLAKLQFENIGAKDVLANSTLQCGILYVYKKKYDNAYDYLTEALKLSEESGNKKDKMNIYSCFSDLYDAKKEPEKALKYYRLYNSLKDSVLNESNTKAINELNTKYETEKKDKHISLLEKEQQIDKMQLRLKQEQLQKQLLSEHEKSQQLMLVTKDNEIKNLQMQQQSTELQKQKVETEKNKNTVMLMQKESELQQARLQKAALKQTFAIAGIALLIIFLGYTFWRYQQRINLSNRLSKSLTDLKETQGQLIETEKMREQENVRLRISRDIHDEIGSNLTKIALLSEMLTSEGNSVNGEIKHSLEKISEYARAVNSSLSDIIWSVNPGQDTLESLVAYMRNYVHSFLQDTGINFQINFPSGVDNKKINPDFKRTIFLILKETLNNCVKHSNAKNIVVRFLVSKNHFEFSVKDDGTGFDVAAKSTLGNGLNNMEYRVKQFNGDFKVFSSPENGCEVDVRGELV
ncbi:MAG: DUF2225 domain-containing protein [Bacteroidota bacterium]